MSDGAVVLLSGGLDSGTSLAMWRASGAPAHCVFADYGQRAVAAEVEYGRRLAERFDATWETVDLPWLARAAAATGCALSADGEDLPERTVEDPGDAASARAVWVPARNVVLAAAAAALAEAHGADWVVAGFNREEAATFPDNSPAFVAAGTAFLGLGTRGSVRLESPTLALDKPAIVQAARQLGLSRDDVWSCYHGGEAPCGSCESCVRSARAWA